MREERPGSSGATGSQLTCSVACDWSSPLQYWLVIGPLHYHTNTCVVSAGVGSVSSRVYCDRQTYFKPKLDINIILGTSTPSPTLTCSQWCEDSEVRVDCQNLRGFSVVTINQNHLPDYYNRQADYYDHQVMLSASSQILMLIRISYCSSREMTGRFPQVAAKFGEI